MCSGAQRLLLCLHGMGPLHLQLLRWDPGSVVGGRVVDSRAWGSGAGWLPGGGAPLLQWGGGRQQVAEEKVVLNDKCAHVPPA
jgi:hypothetical protein